MPNAMKEPGRPLASVCLVSRETLMLSANLNAPSTKSVQHILPASLRSARILVQEYVALMPLAL